MDIQELREERRKLERDIGNLVVAFTIKTDVIVDRVDINNMRLSEMSEDHGKLIFTGAEVTVVI